MKKVPFVLLFTMLFSLCLFAKENNNQKANSSLYKPLSTSDIWLNANRMNGAFRNNGIWHFDVIKNTWGLEWPKGSGNSPIFAGGQWVAGKINGEIRVAGIQHSATEFQPGLILSPGVADNPKDGKYIWYQLLSSGSDDRSRWPVDQGAPVDENGDPQLFGDQTIYSVWNDLADHSLYGSNKLSVEVHQTAFAFNRADALGDMHFIKWLLVNKSGQDWEDSYFSIWLDPDLGGATDDLVGCDTTLGLGYTYNAVPTDQSYGSTPPAQGIDFFQGPIVDEPGSSVTLPDGTVLTDKKMLKMTSFVFYNNNDLPNGNPDNAHDVWGYMTGFWRDDVPITYGDRGRTVGNTPTSFMFSGDPVTQSGWLDSEADDRRFLMTTGPFPMPAWSDENGNGQPDFGEPGVQEIVAGVILAQGTDYLNSVTKLKEVDALAQLAYDLNFNLAKSPLPPVVQTSATGNKVVLTWDETSELNPDGSPYESQDPIVAAAVGDTVIIDNTVKVIDDDAYNFYGYSVYQYSDASGRDPVLIDHWDIGPTVDPTDYTAQRFTTISQNKNSVVGVSNPLINGKEYYFGVVAEGYLEYGAPVILTSPPTIVTVIPGFSTGMSYSSAYGDTLDVVHNGGSDGSAVVWVVDPTKTTGLEYEVTFNADLTWNLSNANGIVAENQTNQTGDDAYNVYDGLLVKVQGPAAGINLFIPGPYGPDQGEDGWNFQGNRWMSGADVGGSAFFGGLFNGADFFGSDLTPADYTDIEMRWAGATDRSDLSAAGLAAASQAEMPERWSKAAVYRRDLGYAVQPTLGDVPFAVYDTWAVPERRLKVAFVEMDGQDGAAANLLWDMGWDGAAFPGELGAREYIFILTDTYDEDYTDYLDGTLDGTFNGNEYDIWPGARGTHPYLEEPFEMQVYAGKPNTSGDTFTFTAPAAGSSSKKSVKADMDKIKVVPNPYYGYHSGELDPFDRWVQFTYLPDRCTVRIFDLAGNLIRKLEKNDPDTPFMRWDLKNEFEIPVASGIYVFYVTAPFNVGEKIGKIAIFAPNERLDTY